MSSVHHSLVGGAEAARSHTSLVATGDTPPTKKTLSNSKPYAAAPNPKQEETNKDLGTEMRGHFVGPMPVQEFLDEFMSLPEDGGQCPTVPSTLFHSVMGEGVNNESAMYNPFVSITLVVSSHRS